MNFLRILLYSIKSILEEYAWVFVVDLKIEIEGIDEYNSTNFFKNQIGKKLKSLE